MRFLIDAAFPVRGAGAEISTMCAKIKNAEIMWSQQIPGLRQQCCFCVVKRKSMARMLFLIYDSK